VSAWWAGKHPATLDIASVERLQMDAARLLEAAITALAYLEMNPPEGSRAPSSFYTESVSELNAAIDRTKVSA